MDHQDAGDRYDDDKLPQPTTYDPQNMLLRPEALDITEAPIEYKLYKRRFVGCVALCLLNTLGGLNWLWFSAISITTANAFNLSINRVNWLSNSVNLIYLPVSFLVPWTVRRIGTRNSSILAAVFFLVGSWLRYAGTSKSLTPGSTYALLLLGQIFVGFSQPWPQIVAPSYSQAWFGLQGRTTATMVISLTNPVGSALAQLLSPIFSTPKASLLALGIITSVIAPCALLIEDKPPTPPTYAGSQTAPPVLVTVRSALGCPLPHEKDDAMTWHQRLDFAILTFGFGTVVGVISAFSVLIAQVYAPYGYSDDQSGLVGAALFLSGLAGAILTAPLFDRVLTHRLALTLKTALPITAAAWISLIWAVGAKSGLGASYAIVCISGFSSFMLLPVTLELACEVTGSAETSSAALWFSANALTVLFVLVAGDLRGGPDASPPGSMRTVLILFACLVSVVAVCMLGLEGKQVRRRMDEERERQDAS